MFFEINMIFWFSGILCLLEVIEVFLMGIVRQVGLESFGNRIFISCAFLIKLNIALRAGFNFLR